MANQAQKLEDQFKASINRARQEPMWLMREVLNIKTNELDKRRGISWDIDPWYEELVESIADVDRHRQGLPTKYNHEGLNKISVRAMHGPGKTFGAAGIMHWFNFCYHGLIICTAPKANQLKTRLWPAFRKIQSRAGEAYKKLMKVDAYKITWCDDEDWAAYAETASTPENLAGHHGDYVLVIVDEASGVKEEMYPVIDGIVSTGVITIVLLIGNPTKNSGTFYDSHMRDLVSKNYYRIHINLERTTRVSKKWVNQMKDKYGADSPIFKVRCEGNFAGDAKHQLISLQWIVTGRNKEFIDDGSIPRLVISVDVSDGGEDETSCTAGKHYQTFRYFMKQKNASFPSETAQQQTAKMAADMFNDYGGNIDNGDVIVVDCLGVGTGAAALLQSWGYPVVRYKGGEKAMDPEEHRNMRTQVYCACRDDHQTGRVIYADDFVEESEWDDFEGQVCAIKTRPGADKTEDLVTKEQMLSQGEKSPDRADSLAMQYATSETVLNKTNIVPETLGHMISAHETY